MMRSPTSFAVVVRRRDGSLHVREKAMVDARKGVAKLPFLRGVAAIVESFKLGGEALRFSADQMERDLDAAERAQTATKPRGGRDGIGTSIVRTLMAVAYTLFLLLSADDETGAKGEETVESIEKNDKEKSKGPMVLMLVLMVGFFVALPQASAAGMNKLLGLHLGVQSAGFQAMTGIFKLALIIGYLLVIRRLLPDIRRVFQYHGAEHKTISTYEANEPLTVQAARAKSTLHPRCGTTFLVMVAFVSILVFTAVGSFLPKIETGKIVVDNVLFFLEKLPFLPVIAAVTFEIQRIFARYCTAGPLRALLWPGFLCQKITTIEPTDDQLEVALASLRVTLFREDGIETSPSPQEAFAPADVRYRNFDALMKSPRLRMR